MFNSLSMYDLQSYWWMIISLLGGLLVFVMFVQGGQTLLYTLGKTEDERTTIIASLGRKWELSFTTLVLFGGALFAAFPLFYAVSFGGAYYLWMAILFAFIAQAISYEYRKKPNNFFGQRFYERLMFFNGSVGTILIGVVVGTLVTGGNFIVNDSNLSHWTTHTYGLEAIVNPFNLALGLSVFFLARILAAMYFINNIDEKHIQARAREVVGSHSKIFIILLSIVSITIFLKDGLSYDETTNVVTVESFKYFKNLLAMPTVALLLVLGILLILKGMKGTVFENSNNGIWFAGTGTVLLIFSIFALLGLNHTVFYPSLANIQHSLTITNSSGSRYSLVVMSYVSLMVPFVLGYIILVWRAMDKTKITTEEIISDSHHY